ncbi:MAG: PLP-dependent transferase [Methanothrix sp.]|nr:PLP-dependent transferase [Methanothrix sp.]
MGSKIQLYLSPRFLLLDEVIPVPGLIQDPNFNLPDAVEAFHAPFYMFCEVVDHGTNQGGQHHVHLHSILATNDYIFDQSQVGDEIVSANNLYGGTYELFHYTFPKLGRKVIFVDSTKPEEFEKAINSKTRAIYAETRRCNDKGIGTIWVYHNKGHGLAYVCVAHVMIFIPISYTAQIIDLHI